MSEEITAKSEFQELEATVLGLPFVEPYLGRVLVESISRDVFRTQQHRNIFKMLQTLVDKGLEPTLANATAVYAKHMHLVGGISYLTQIAGAAIGVSGFDRMIQQLIELDSRRKAKELIREYWEKFDDPSRGSFEELLDQFEQQALTIRPPTRREANSVDALVTWFEDLVLKTSDPKRAFGILTGWEALDRLTLGFQRTDFTILGARTSMGKTAFATEIMLRAQRRGYKVACFSLEMTVGQIFNRMVSNICGIPMQQIRTGKISPGDIEQISATIEELRKFHIDDARGVTAEYICSEMRRLKRQDGLDLVIVDYIQEVVEPGEKSDHGGSAAQRISQKLRKAARDCDCAVIGLSQVKQEVETRSNKRPFVSDLFGGAALGAIADNVILLYRDDYYNADSAEKDILEVNLAKQRNGPTGLVKLHYDKHHQKISNMTYHYEDSAGPAGSSKRIPDMYRGGRGA